MKKIKLLIIDDEPGITSFLKEGLEEAGYSVEIASDGKSGLDLAMSNNYNLLILDWMIPAISGIEVCNRIRKKGNMVPIIFLTAKKTLDDLVLGFEAGANDYIKKPFEFEELLVRINAQLKKNLPSDNIFKAGKLTINPLSHQVFFDSKEITLTPKEFALLEYLVHNMDSVCTRNRILQKVWEIPSESDTSVVDVFITFIRRKLEKAGGRKIIQTIYGVGYIVRERDLL
jgi:DNA-binding response OmpR family regulator